MISILKTSKSQCYNMHWSKVDGLHKDIKVTPTDYLENTLTIIKFWRVFYYNRIRDKIDPKSWLEHSDVSVVNAFYSGDANNIEFPAGILQAQNS